LVRRDASISFVELGGHDLRRADVPPQGALGQYQHELPVGVQRRLALDPSSHVAVEFVAGQVSPAERAGVVLGLQQPEHERRVEATDDGRRCLQPPDASLHPTRAVREHRACLGRLLPQVLCESEEVAPAVRPGSVHRAQGAYLIGGGHLPAGLEPADLRL